MKLSIVGLPIGNIDDISLRAIKTIASSDILICEDSRMFHNLWTKLCQNGMAEKYDGRVFFLNDFNEERSFLRLINELEACESGVLVSDAGMPLISDPGFKLVREWINRNHELSCVPGPTAEVTALVLSGIPCDKYFFVGFLPKKPGKRLDMLTDLAEYSKNGHFAVVIYETLVRLPKVIPDLINTFGGDARCALVVDATKISEKVVRCDLLSLLEKSQSIKKGEAVLVLQVGS